MTEAEILELETITKAALLSAMANPQPSYRAGEYEVKHNEYIKSLLDILKQCREWLGQLPFEEETVFIR